MNTKTQMNKSTYKQWDTGRQNYIRTLKDTDAQDNIYYKQTKTQMDKTVHTNNKTPVDKSTYKY